MLSTTAPDAWRANGWRSLKTAAEVTLFENPQQPTLCYHRVDDHLEFIPGITATADTLRFHAPPDGAGRTVICTVIDRDGWTVRVNGQRVDKTPDETGFVRFRAPASGDVQLSFQYVSRRRALGTLLAGLALFGGYWSTVRFWDRPPAARVV